MRAELIFELPEDKDDFTLATRGVDLWNCLWEFDQWLRSEIKYHDEEELERVRERLYDVMNSNNIDLDMVS